MKSSLTKEICSVLLGCITLMGSVLPAQAGEVPSVKRPVAASASTVVLPRQSVVPKNLAETKVQRLPNLYPNSGNGPLPDISNWLPTGQIPQGGYIRIRGSKLVPGRTFVAIGAVHLTPGALQTASEMEFIVPANLLVPEGQPLVVYNMGGQVKTLEESYKVYPKAFISKIEPTNFKKGDRVKVSGKSLFLAKLQWQYSPVPLNYNQTVYDSSLAKGDFIIIDKNQLTGANNVMILNPVFSGNGDILEFTAGAIYESAPVNYCWSSGGCAPSRILHPRTPLPPTFPGPFLLYIPGGGYVQGPLVAWRP